MPRWKIAILVAVAIARDIPVSNEQFSQLQSAFLIAYAFMYAGGGKLMDVLDTRRGFTVIMGVLVARLEHAENPLRH